MRGASLGRSSRSGGKEVESFNREVAKEVGSFLRRTREEKGIPLEKVEAATFISARFLQALEEGAWESLPGKTYVLGYVKIYARFLGLNQEEASALAQRAYEEKRRHSERSEETPEKPKRKRGKRVLLGVLVFLVILCSVILVVFFTPLFPWKEESSQNTEMTAVELSPSPVLESPTPPSFAVVLRLEAEKPAWIEATSLGKTLFSGILVPGKTYIFKSEGPIELSGDGGNSVRVWLNGEERGYLAQDSGSFQETFTP